MRETIEIIHAFERAKRSGESCVLASVVRVKGSTYRRPGARALFVPGGTLIGLIGGGCLENDLRLHAAEVLDAGRPRVLTYDNALDGDILWGLGLGCNGRVDILLEAVSADRPGPLDVIARCLDERIPAVIATVIQCEDASRLAGRWIVDHDGGVLQSADSDVLPGFPAEAASVRKPRIVGSGTMEILLEPIDPPLRLLIAGAGPDAVPLAAIAASLGWSVEIFDHREGFARRDHFPGARSVSVAPVAEIPRVARTDRRTAVVLMTHHFLNDRELLRGFLESEADYLGVLGPRTRLENLLDSLQADGYAPSPERLRRLRAPVGLALGAETPDEIALSIAAEIQACFAGHDGTPLTFKSGPIHG